MTTGARLTAAAAALVLMVAGGSVVAGGWQEAAPQPATPTSDPIAEALKRTAPVQTPPVAPPATVTVGPPDEPAPEMVAEEPTDEKAEAQNQPQEPAENATRRRLRVVVVEAIDKITAERMRFEVVVGGRPVRFNDSLIFTARACELSAPTETVEDAIAYMDVSLQSKSAVPATEARQIFRGWMFASTPAVSGLQHPLYDAWVVGCKA